VMSPRPSIWTLREDIEFKHLRCAKSFSVRVVPRSRKIDPVNSLADNGPNGPLFQ
jgi:hypothetical protein